MAKKTESKTIERVSISSIDDKKTMPWSDLEKKYGNSIGERTNTVLKEYNKLFGSYKRLIKPPEPLLLMQFKTGVSEWFSGVTQGVFTYTGSDGQQKKVWLSLKFLSTMKWGEDTARYYNCTEDKPFPNGMDDIIVTAEDIEKILIKRDLDHEKLRAKDLEAQAGVWMNAGKAIALIIFAGFAGLAVASFFGVDVIELFRGSAQPILTNITNVTNTSNITSSSLGIVTEGVQNITLVR